MGDIEVHKFYGYRKAIDLWSPYPNFFILFIANGYQYFSQVAFRKVCRPNIFSICRKLSKIARSKIIEINSDLKLRKNPGFLYNLDGEQLLNKLNNQSAGMQFAFTSLKDMKSDFLNYYHPDLSLRITKQI